MTESKAAPTLPNLAGVATADLVQSIGTGSYSADYINWARTVQKLRESAPDWMPEVVPAPDDGLLHAAPVGAYMLIRFRHIGSGLTTAPVPHAVMDAKNNAMPRDKITARDITDTHRRGVCLAAAFTFGLAHELWAKMPLETGYGEPVDDDAVEWLDAIAGASDSTELDRIGANLKEQAGTIPADAMKRIRAAWAKRAKDVKVAK